ncbi:uncharacterized protein TEOVI_000311100 [Trypanosoma equiperdum]|uniref:Uncharacterized protein n=4 Tax=Trypanozoon TaxID=39700 RepID=Q583H7_TRYB2|nr:hypothetical protein, conserved [Trypanosoma brucei gambiense DAL972]XP_844533.1 hypothetical protein, conserved [Trypanosoma brucei brucei TREU927]AAX80200.1 hypothetical protein, conserved [Trypanosoma brucei]RHW73058.1 hypothetical protein DPX39_040069500 [Trypanosoma brucei equiperdum]SCU71530.1 hypothetical protein, conserved [Trypanosoma equiperdum]AAZ10974.1 hypothetical protein, conserved [Trypanosoma brucei brucei TREU927]CBH10691.1 hypothetical protein, conserved [Trypanosoma bru|eukprot:XP_011772979.1 hypothetical protein, conserved [Trypanosoma brucei gambiense DAL972]
MEPRTVRAYLEQRVQHQYFDVIPSRWRPLLTRLAKLTQTLQRDGALAVGNNKAAAIRSDFDLANALLEEEHEIYREGLTYLRGRNNGEECANTAALRRFLHGMLSCIAAKEISITHWKNCLTSVSPDTLRVYCHMCVAHPHVQKDDTARICLLYSQPA